ncbi:MAG: hypothetical protein K6E16_09825 [Lachnospiraceae bacterium]|nr:hypothetical protein [Lachnospiraceae bacterium]
MKKAVRIALGVLGALGVGLVGLILACHFKPGLSDAIADKLYKNRAERTQEAKLSEEEDKELDNLSLSDLTGEAMPEDEQDESRLIDDTVSEDPQESEGDADVVMTPVTLKSLEDYGLTQEDVLNNEQEYFDNCYDQLAAYKGESTSFYNVVCDSTLGNKVLQCYDNESYRAGFMNRFMDDYKVDTCGWSVDEEELQGGYILVKHTFTR